MSAPAGMVGLYPEMRFFPPAAPDAPVGAQLHTAALKHLMGTVVAYFEHLSKLQGAARWEKTEAGFRRQYTPASTGVQCKDTP